ncbi:MAG: siroheme synthase [Herbinix sp.]|jgi:siroheme synthase-like protein|nr:siroheme synthase [Herbinix sp.]
MAYFPFYMDITDKLWVIVGGGTIALHKIKILLEFGANMTVIAPVLQEDIRWLQRQGEQQKQYKIDIWERDFEDSDLQRADYVIAATDDNQLNSHIAQLCRAQNKLVNVVDVKEECSFIFPSIQKMENLVVAVSTGGNNPALAAKLKKDLETVIPDYYGTFNELLGEYRDYIKQKIADPKVRKKLYQDLIIIAEAKDRSLSEEELRDIIHRYCC